MPLLGKRKRVSSTRAARTAVRVGNWKSVVRAAAARRRVRIRRFGSALLPRVNRLESMIETKEAAQVCESDAVTKYELAHNNVTIIPINSAGAHLNPFNSTNGNDDPMGNSPIKRIGDKISLKGMKVAWYFENALSRPKVYYRIMLMRCPRGEDPTRSNVFKGICANKMIDQLNTERFGIVWQTTFNISASNGAATSVNAVGAVATGSNNGIMTRKGSAWIPGRRFGKNGVIQFTNATTSGQVKYYDYKFIVVAYDWFGTPQDVNNVGLINCFYSKLYFKDA